MCHSQSQHRARSEGLDESKIAAVPATIMPSNPQGKGQGLESGKEEATTKEVNKLSEKKGRHHQNVTF